MSGNDVCVLPAAFPKAKPPATGFIGWRAEVQSKRGAPAQGTGQIKVYGAWFNLNDSDRIRPIQQLEEEDSSEDSSGDDDSENGEEDKEGDDSEESGESDSADDSSDEHDSSPPHTSDLPSSSSSNDECEGNDDDLPESAKRAKYL